MNIVRAVCFSLTTLFTFVGYPAFAENLENSPAQKIIFLGDSLTEGYGVSQEQAYPALVQERAKAQGKNWQIINAGISGSTTASALSRVKWQLKQKPTAILIALGANDGLRGVPVKTSEANLAAAIQAAQNAKVKIWLAGMRLPPNYGAQYTKDFEKMFQGLSKKYHIPLLPFLLDKVAGHSELNQPDGIHPNEKGHKILADTVFKFVQENM
jgi:acyl-CoA thioesterase-1